MFVRAPVEHILLSEDGKRAVGVRVRGVDLHSKLVVSTAGYLNTYKYLIPRGLEALGIAPEQGDAESEKKEEAEDIPSFFTPSIAMFSTFIGLEGSQEELNLPKTNKWVLSTWNHDAAYERFMGDMDAPFPACFIRFYFSFFLFTF